METMETLSIYKGNSCHIDQMENERIQYEIEMGIEMALGN